MIKALLIITASVLALASGGNVALAQSGNPNPMVESNPNPAVQSDQNAIDLRNRESMARIKVRRRVSAAVAALESTIRELQLSPDTFGGRRGLALASSRQAVEDLRRVLEYHEPPASPPSNEANPARRGR